MINMANIPVSGHNYLVSPTATPNVTRTRSSMPHKTVLLVENNPDEEELLSLALEKSEIPLELVVVRDGIEAIDYLLGKEQFANCHTHQSPALILLDLNLPKIDGLEVLRRLRADRRTQHLPIVMMAASKDPQDILYSYSYGCNSYLRKPVNFSEYQTLVKNLVVYWLQCNETSFQEKNLDESTPPSPYSRRFFRRF